MSQPRPSNQSAYNRREAIRFLFGCVGFGVTGCFPKVQQIKAPGLWQRIGGTTPSDMLLRTMLIERSRGDEYLNHGIWSSSQQILSHELSSLLGQNGLRLGLITGIPRGELERVFQNDVGAIDPKERTLKPNSPRILPIQGPLERCQIHVIADLAAEPMPRIYHQLECGLNVQAEPVYVDRIKLTCEPQVQHGEKELVLKPSADLSQFQRQERKPLEAFNTLSFEATLGAEDFLIFGATTEATGKLGEAFFYSNQSDTARQRLLILKALRPTGTVQKPAL